MHFVPFPSTKSLFLQLGTNDGIQNSLHRCRPTQLSANKVGISGSSPDRAPKRQQAITWSKKAYTYTSLHLSFACLCQIIQPINVDETRKRGTNSNNNHKRSQTNQLIFTLPIKDNREDLSPNVQEKEANLLSVFLAVAPDLTMYTNVHAKAFSHSLIGSWLVVLATRTQYGVLSIFTFKVHCDFLWQHTETAILKTDLLHSPPTKPNC